MSCRRRCTHEVVGSCSSRSRPKATKAILVEFASAHSCRCWRSPSSSRNPRARTWRATRRRRRRRSGSERLRRGRLAADVGDQGFGEAVIPPRCRRVRGSRQPKWNGDRGYANRAHCFSRDHGLSTACCCRGILRRDAGRQRAGWRCPWASRAWIHFRARGRDVYFGARGSGGRLARPPRSVSQGGWGRLAVLSAGGSRFAVSGFRCLGCRLARAVADPRPRIGQTGGGAGGKASAGGRVPFRERRSCRRYWEGLWYLSASGDPDSRLGLSGRPASWRRSAVVEYLPDGPTRSTAAAEIEARGTIMGERRCRARRGHKA